MSSCSCQHLLTSSDSLRHSGSWDLGDELQSAVCRGGGGGFIKGNTPFQQGGRLQTIITCSAASCCTWTLSSLCWLLPNLFTSKQQQPMCSSYAHKPLFGSWKCFSRVRAFGILSCLPPQHGANVFCLGFRLFPTWHGPWRQVLGAFWILLKLLITWSEAHRLVHFRSGGLTGSCLTCPQAINSP